MPKIKSEVSERMSKTTDNIDLSTAENWLLRLELIEICRAAIREKLVPRVRFPCSDVRTLPLTPPGHFHIRVAFRASLVFWTPSVVS